MVECQICGEMTGGSLGGPYVCPACDCGVPLRERLKMARETLLASLRIDPKDMRLGDHVTATNLKAGGSEAKEVRDGEA